MCCFKPVLCCFRQPIPFMCLYSMCMYFSMTNMSYVRARVSAFTPDLAKKKMYIYIYIV